MNAVLEHMFDKVHLVNVKVCFRCASREAELSIKFNEANNNMFPF